MVVQEHLIYYTYSIAVKNKKCTQISFPSWRLPIIVVNKHFGKFFCTISTSMNSLLIVSRFQDKREMYCILQKWIEKLQLKLGTCITSEKVNLAFSSYSYMYFLSIYQHLKVYYSKFIISNTVILI